MHRFAVGGEHRRVGTAWRVQFLLLLVYPGAVPAKEASGEGMVSQKGEKVKKLKGEKTIAPPGLSLSLSPPVGEGLRWVRVPQKSPLG